QFGECEASEQRHHSAENPYQQEPHGMGQGRGNVLGGEENGRTNDAADQQQNGVQQGKATNQRRLGFSRCVRVCWGRGGKGHCYPIPSSSGDSKGVPQRRQITAEQSPQVSGSATSAAQLGQ